MVGMAVEGTAVTRPPAPPELPEEEFRWCSVRLEDAFDRGLRLKAAVFDIEGRHARGVLQRCRWPLSYVAGESGLAVAFHLPRFKRIWVEESRLAIYQPSQATEIDPKPSGFLSPITGTDIEALRVKNDQILMTCSGRGGSIGRTAYVSETLHDRVFSHDLIRIECTSPGNSGYLYAFLTTETGRALVKTNEYGAMVPHIEPSHLESVLVPVPPDSLKKRIHDLVLRSYALRDESNALLREAEQLLYQELKLPPLSALRPRYFDQSADLRNYTVPLCRLGARLDGSYHVPIVETMMACLETGAVEVTTVGDPRISKRIILPGRFARVYVKEGQGIPFFGGKELHKLDPDKKKYLSLKHHGDRIRNQLLLEENMVMITCSGTIAKIALVPQHWEGWTANQHIIRVEPASVDVAGYLYVFLATEYGHELVRRFTYGSVVDEIDDHHVSQVPVPLLRNSSTQDRINRLALDANAKRADAYHTEQEAIRVTNEEVIHAREG